MLVSLLLYVLTVIASVVVAVLPSASTIPVPSGFANALSSIGSYVGSAAAMLPSGTLSNMAAAMAVIATVNLFVIPWAAARNFRLPFSAATKQSST